MLENRQLTLNNACAAMIDDERVIEEDICCIFSRFVLTEMRNASEIRDNQKEKMEESKPILTFTTGKP